jgi:hypothetical protein
MKKSIYFFYLLLIVLAVSCGTTTDITGSYKQPEMKDTNYKKVFVAALTDNAYAKQAVESSLAKMLTAKGAATLKSIDKLPPNFAKVAEQKDREMLLEKLREDNCDAIMTVALIDAKDEKRYVPGNEAYFPMGYGYYGGFGSYYAYGYNNFYSPGYYTDDKIYYLEVNLYDAKSEKLVWSAQSKTYNPSDIEDFLNGYSKAVSDQMATDGIMTGK